MEEAHGHEIAVFEIRAKARRQFGTGVFDRIPIRRFEEASEPDHASVAITPPDIADKCPCGSFHGGDVCRFRPAEAGIVIGRE